MGTSAATGRGVGEAGYCTAEPTLEKLERAARLLPDTDLKSAILATLGDREPTVREALAWVAALQGHRRVRD
jgi:hypothetical protein